MSLFSNKDFASVLSTVVAAIVSPSSHPPSSLFLFLLPLLFPFLYHHLLLPFVLLINTSTLSFQYLAPKR